MEPWNTEGNIQKGGRNDGKSHARRGGHIGALPPGAEQVGKRSDAPAGGKPWLSHGQFHDILEMVTDGILWLDRKWRIQYCNRAGAILLGLEREHVVGSLLSEVFPDAKRGLLLAECERAVEAGTPVHCEEFISGPIDRWVEIDAYPSINGLYLILKDVTRRRLLENELRRGKEELETRVRERTRELMEANSSLEAQAMQIDAFFAHSISPLAFLDPKFNFIRVNEAYAAACGRKAEEFPGQNYFRMFPSSQMRTGFERVVESGKPLQIYRWPYKNPDRPEWGTTYWDLCLEPIFDDSGKIEFLVFSLDNVTEQKRAEEVLSETEQRLKNIIDHAPVYIFMKDLDGRYTVMNRMFEKGFGQSPEAVIGKTAHEIFPPDIADRFVKNDRKVLETGSAQEFEEEVQVAGGLRDFSALLFPLRNLENRIYAICGIAIDVTDRKNAERELQEYTRRLEELNNELQQFAYVASHDLQEPLRKIKAFGEMLKTRYRDKVDDTGKDYIDRMSSAAGRMENFISDLLKYSRIVTKAESFEGISLNSVLDEVYQTFEYRVQNTGGKIEIGDLPAVEADSTQMKQLFQNLIGNSLKFQKPGQKPIIKIYAEKEETVCRICVEDNGIGFEEKFLDRIFVPFQRLHGRSEYEGTGMGLAICKKIVERHGGSITAKSSPEKGATFIVTLPLRRDG